MKRFIVLSALVAATVVGAVCTFVGVGMSLTAALPDGLVLGFVAQLVAGVAMCAVALAGGAATKAAAAALPA